MDADLLAMPLWRVPFCIIDVETSGTDAATHRITELGAIRVEGGEWVASLDTLVGGLHCDEPSIEELVPTLVEFVRGSVVVGHNVRFDLRFVNAALEWAEHETLDPADAIDTVLLARRLVSDDADDCRLGTLAARFDLPHRPNHRAHADAAATVDLLHLLLERASAYGVFTLDDLIEFPALATHRYAEKLKLTSSMPRGPGKFRCHGHRDEIILEGAADDVRRAVRHLFSGVDRRRMTPVLRDLCRVSSSVAAADTDG
ncbi:MAG: exonuclease domain-containing protein [Ilumatobacteraceae bacterium]